MSTAAYLDVFGAPSSRAVAAELSAAVGVPPALEGTTPNGEAWALGAPDWRIDVYEQYETNLLPGEGFVWVSVQHTGGDVEPLHRLLDSLYRRIVSATPWGVTAESEADGFPARSRTASAA